MVTNNSCNIPSVNHTLIVGTGTGFTDLSTGSVGQVLQSGGASADPAYSTATYPSTAGVAGNVLTSDGTNFNSTPVASSPLITTYTSSGTWTINSKSTLVRFLAWGGGGGGGSGKCGVSGNSSGGGGGGGGGYVDVTYDASVLSGSPYTVTIGTGGNGGASINATTTNGNPGIMGNPTSVGSVVIASGGGPGGGGTSTGIGAGSGLIYTNGISATSFIGGGTSGAGSANASSIVYGASSGGGGGTAYTASTPRTGATGGNITAQDGTILVAGGTAGNNSGGTGGNGNSPSNQSLFVGGTGGGGGGCDGVSVAGSGGNGATPSGGGGGGAGNLSLNASGAGGNGANGQVVIIEYF